MVEVNTDWAQLKADLKKAKHSFVEKFQGERHAEISVDLNNSGNAELLVREISNLLSLIPDMHSEIETHPVYTKDLCLIVYRPDHPDA